MPFEVTFIQKKEVKKEKTLLEVAEKLELPIKSTCGGNGKCGKCVVKIVEGALPEPTKAERKHLGDEKLEQGYRLACEVTINENCKVELP